MENRHLHGLVLIGSITILLVILYILTRNSPIVFGSGPNCTEKGKMVKLDLNALTSLKYLDSLNHNYQTVQFTDIKSKEELKVFFINEKSGFYNSIKIGDTVIKKAGSLDIWTSNPKVTSPLSYDCPDGK